MNRRHFISKAAITVGGTTALMLASKAFGDVVQPAPTPVDCPPLAVAPAIASQVLNNHGHVLVLSYEEVIKSVPKTYSIKGSSGHAHNVDMTEAHFETLRQVGTVEVLSTTDFGHAHKIQVTRDLLP